MACRFSMLSVYPLNRGQVGIRSIPRSQRVKCAAAADRPSVRQFIRRKTRVGKTSADAAIIVTLLFKSIRLRNVVRCGKEKITLAKTVKLTAMVKAAG